jgi:homospermidine synthase
MKKPNLLVLGASGAVAGALLHYLVRHRRLLGDIVLLDRSGKVVSSPAINHRALRYVFLKDEIRIPEGEAKYLRILKKYSIDIVIDLTDADSIPLLEATDRAGVCYVNTALNDDDRTVAELVSDVYPRRKRFDSAVHILCTGMNPGVVNSWVKYGIGRYGKPEEVVHFEYDTSMASRRWIPMITWSPHEFLIESVKNPSGVMLGRGKLKPVLPNAIENMVGMESVLSPIMELKEYPRGFLMLHEENLTIAEKYDVPSKFIYAIDMRTMERMKKVYKRKKTVMEKDLLLADNMNVVLDGSDSIGVMLRYKDKLVYYFNTAPNIAVRGTNGTCQQVATGIFAALLVLLFNRPKKGAYFVEDLPGRTFMKYVFDNMRVQEFIFRKRRLVGYTPEVRLSGNEHIYMR